MTWLGAAFAGCFVVSDAEWDALDGPAGDTDADTDADSDTDTDADSDADADTAHTALPAEAWTWDEHRTFVCGGTATDQPDEVDLTGTATPVTAAGCADCDLTVSLAPAGPATTASSSGTDCNAHPYWLVAGVTGLFPPASSRLYLAAHEGTALVDVAEVRPVPDARGWSFDYTFVPSVPATSSWVGHVVLTPVP